MKEKKKGNEGEEKRKYRRREKEMQEKRKGNIEEEKGTVGTAEQEFASEFMTGSKRNLYTMSGNLLAYMKEVIFNLLAVYRARRLNNILSEFV